MKPETSKYAPLPVDAEDESTPLSSEARVAIELQDPDLEAGPSRASRYSCSSTSYSDKSKPSRLVFWTCLATLFCSILNLIFLLMSLPLPLSSHPAHTKHRTTVTHQTDPSLPRPNAYIGLDTLPPNITLAALPPSLVVFPPLFQPVDHVHRFRVFPEDETARFTFNGRVSPGDKHVVLSEHVTMIAQFRVLDYGMERCRIASSIPNPKNIASENQTFHLDGDTSLIEVWNLTTPTTPAGHAIELDPRALTWDNKPPRERIVTRVGVERDKTTESGEFWCGPSGSLQTLELLCRGKACYVELWQNYYFKPRFGIYVTQHPSV